MLGFQLAACDPAVCDSQIPLLDVSTAGTIKRRATVTTSGYVDGLVYFSFIERGLQPFCPAGEKKDISSLLYNYFGLELKSIDNNGYRFIEYQWSYSSATKHTFTGTVYKRPGTNTILCNSFSAAAMRYTYTASYFRLETTEPVLSSPFLYHSSPYTSCGCSDPGCSTPYNVYAYRYEQVDLPPTTASTWTSQGGIPTTIQFYWKPIAMADVNGLVIQLKAAALAAGPWSISVGVGVITIMDAIGTTYTFSGTLSSVASAISATAGSTLFTASVPSGVLGSVALVSDLKDQKYPQVSTASCNVGLVLIRGGEAVPPSNISTSHVFRTISSPLCVDPVYLSYADAVAAGAADTHDAYEVWFRTPRYPKFPAGWAENQGFVLDPEGIMPVAQLFVGCTPLGAKYNILDYWLESGGISTRLYSNTTDSGISTTFSYTLSCSFCGSPNVFLCGGTGCCNGFILREYEGCNACGSFCSCPEPGQVCWHGWNREDIEEYIPAVEVGGGSSLGGVWFIE